jgi:pentatricopeptide repeat protein
MRATQGCVKPNTQCYNTVMAAFARAGKAIEAASIIQQLLDLLAI